MFVASQKKRRGGGGEKFIWKKTVNKCERHKNNLGAKVNFGGYRELRDDNLIAFAKLDISWYFSSLFLLQLFLGIFVFFFLSNHGFIFLTARLDFNNTANTTFMRILFLALKMLFIPPHVGIFISSFHFYDNLVNIKPKISTPNEPNEQKGEERLKNTEKSKKETFYDLIFATVWNACRKSERLLNFLYFLIWQFAISSTLLNERRVL